MYGRSERFDDAVTNGGTVASRLDVLRDGFPIASIGSGADVAGAGVTAGDVTVDVTATVRRTLKVSITDSTGEWTPKSVDDLLSVVSGNELRAWRGWRYPDGSEELLSEGVFVINEPQVDDGPTGTLVSVTGEDRARTIRDNLFVKTYTVARNTDIITAAQAIVSNRRPGTQFRGLQPGASPHRTPYLTWEEHSDPMEAVDQVLSGGGLEGFFDIDGFFIIQAIPDPSVLEPAWVYTEGPSSTVLKIQGTANRSDIYNGVIAVGENTFGITPARAEVWDDDPASPTYAGTEQAPGRFGRKPKFLSPNPAITTNAMALDAASGELRRVARLAPGYTVTALPHAAHEGNDVVVLRRSKLGIDDRYVLQRFPIPLDGKSRSDVVMKKLL